MVGLEFHRGGNFGKQMKSQNLRFFGVYERKIWRYKKKGLILQA